QVEDICQEMFSMSKRIGGVVSRSQAYREFFRGRAYAKQIFEPGGNPLNSGAAGSAMQAIEAFIAALSLGTLPINEQTISFAEMAGMYVHEGIGELCLFANIANGGLEGAPNLRNGLAAMEAAISSDARTGLSAIEAAISSDANG